MGYWGCYADCKLYVVYEVDYGVANYAGIALEEGLLGAYGICPQVSHVFCPFLCRSIVINIIELIYCGQAGHPAAPAPPR